MTAQEFIAFAEKRGLHLHAILKEVPKGSKRMMLFGFEYGKRSRKYRQKFMLLKPILLDDLRKGPILKSPIDRTAATDAGSPNASPGEAGDGGVDLEFSP